MLSSRSLVLLLLPIVSPWALPPNRHPNLLPPSGTGWRGSTLGWTSDPADFEKKYNVPLHVYRVFQPWAGMTPAIKTFVSGGGILWYNVAPTNWTAAAVGDEDSAIDGWATDVKSLAPALVFVCISHEPDHNIDESAGRTVKSYHSMWRHIHEKFANAGVTNAVWAMDYSVQVAKSDERFANAVALWPGNDLVDWLFFNAFEKSDEQKTGLDWTALVKKAYTKFETGADNSTHSFTSKPWGLGAFGTHSDVPMDDRNHFLSEAVTALDAGTFPRLRALNYYDSKDSQISDDMKGNYSLYINARFFSANDLRTEPVIEVADYLI